MTQESDPKPNWQQPDFAYVLTEYVGYEGHEILGVSDSLRGAKRLLDKSADWEARQPGDDYGISGFPHWKARQRPESDFFLWVIARIPLNRRATP